MGRKRNINLMVKLTSEEKEKVKEQAKSCGMTVSEYIRAIAVEDRNPADNVSFLHESEVRS